MRVVPEVDLSEWHPPTYSVDRSGKVVGLQPGSRSTGADGRALTKRNSKLAYSERVAGGPRSAREDGQAFFSCLAPW